MVVLEDEEFAEKLDALRYSTTLLVFSPHDLIRDLISLTTNPTSAEPDSFWPSASYSTFSRTSGLLSIWLCMLSSRWPIHLGFTPQLQKCCLQFFRSGGYAFFNSLQVFDFQKLSVFFSAASMISESRIVIYLMVILVDPCLSSL